MKSVVVVENDTARRAMVIARRTGNDVVGMIKAQQIDLLKEKMRNGVAHFIFYKKDGTLREAWGTCAPLLMKNKGILQRQSTWPGKLPPPNLKIFQCNILTDASVRKIRDDVQKHLPYWKMHLF